MAKKEKKDFEEQHPDENVVLLARNHPVVLRKPLYFMLLCITVPILLWSTFLIAIYAWAALVGFVVGSLVLFYFWISFNFSYYIITDQRVLQITQKGFFNRGVIEVGLDKIQNVNYQISGIEQHLLHFGTVIIQTYAGDLVLDKLYQPKNFHERLTATIRTHTKDSPKPWLGEMENE
ncbi:PH domain-containing protein [Candidatus Saccharibacteria bacterium]|nr:PH domain-containing protein [Candidatus Saccharibacteria bacterium]